MFVSNSRASAGEGDACPCLLVDILPLDNLLAILGELDVVLQRRWQTSSVFLGVAAAGTGYAGYDIIDIRILTWCPTDLPTYFV